MSGFQFSLQFPSEHGELRIYCQARVLAVLNLSEKRPQSAVRPAMKLILSGFQKPRWMALARGVFQRLQPVRKDTCGLEFNRDNTSVGEGGKKTHRHVSNHETKCSETKQIFSRRTRSLFLQLPLHKEILTAVRQKATCIRRCVRVVTAEVCLILRTAARRRRRFSDSDHSKQKEKK